MPAPGSCCLLFFGCGAVGFLDDFIKVYTQNNQGLSSRAKMAGQTLVALVFGVLATQFFADDRGVRPASSYISTTHDWGIKLPLVVVLLLIWFIVTATSNGANLTDGADGLLAGASALIFGAYTLVNFWQNNQLCGSSRPTVVESQCYQVRDPLDLAVLSAAITAACIGFLWWNAKPARIIMGDVGSLAIGGALAGLAIMSRTELLMAVIAGLFVLETLSVLLQMSYFKLTRRTHGHRAPHLPHRSHPPSLRAPGMGRGHGGDPLLDHRRDLRRDRARDLLRLVAGLSLVADQPADGPAISGGPLGWGGRAWLRGVESESECAVAAAGRVASDA